MYHIIGADNVEYGPVTAEVLRQWIAQGRANAHTRVRLAGSADWQALSTLPEFAADVGSRPQPEPQHRPHQPRAEPNPFPPRQPTATSAPQFLDMNAADAIAREAIAQGRTFSIGYCLGRGWDLMIANFWTTVGAAALMIVLTTVASSIPVASLLLTYVLLGGLDWYYLRLLRGERAEFSDVFAGFTLAFVPLMLLSVVSQALIGVGFLLCILPGIYLFVVWTTFTALLVMDKKLDFWPAMELSRKVLHRQWWYMFLFLIVLIVIAFSGLLLLCVGVFFTFTWSSLAAVVAYEQLFGGLQAPLPVQTTRPVAPASPPASDPSAPNVAPVTHPTDAAPPAASTSSLPVSPAPLAPEPPSPAPPA